MDAYNILPEEVWTMMLMRADPKDAAYCLHVCDMFRKALEQKRTLVLFALMFPFLERALTVSEVLVLRQICQAWKQGVDAHLQLGTINAFSKCTKHHHRTTFSLAEIDRVEKFWKLWEAFPRSTNPFLTRSLLIRYIVVDPATPAPENARCLNLVEGILAKFGHHVWSLRLHQEGTLLLAREVYLGFVHRFISLMPNLRAIGGDFPDGWGPDLRKATREFPLLPLRQLVMLNLYGDNYGDICQQLLNAAHGSDLQYLGLRNGSWGRLVGNNCPTLITRFLNQEHNTWRITGIGTLTQILSPVWPLKHLVLRVDLTRAETPNSTTIGNLFRGVNVFADTLRNLELNLNGNLIYKADGKLKDLRLSLPNLVMLRMMTATRIKMRTLDFVQELKSLTTLTNGCLTLRTWGRRPDLLIRVERVETGQVPSTNIWNVLPNLEYLVVALSEHKMVSFCKEVEVMQMDEVLV